MSLVTAEHVEQLIRAATVGINNTFTARLNEVAARLDNITPAVIEPFRPVVIDATVNCGNYSLDLIKSLPDFDGDSVSYPAWRAAAKFAMEYYPENSEKFYVATGIMRNKVIGTANSTLSSFNTVLNYKAILAKLDQTYSDKRPLHVLENELSILRQDGSTITEFYDQVDKQLTLITNKQIMTYHGQDDLVDALNERARENALRVFISGLRRPLCDILFSAKPKDLPSALVTAQELETNNKRTDFARIFAAGSAHRNSKPPKAHFSNSYKQSIPVPMDVDSSRVAKKTGIRQNFIPTNFKQQNANSNPMQNFYNTPQQQYSNFNTNGSFPRNPNQYQQPYQNFNTGAIPKRPRDSDSNNSPFYKQQRINHLPDSHSNISNSDDSDDDQSQVSDAIGNIPNHEINFLG